MTTQGPRIGIIGGSGLYGMAMFKSVETIRVGTPYGAPSGAIEVGEFAGRKIAFIPRHGKGHVLPPHKINYRANIWALKSLGVERVLSPCAVGSLQARLRPGTIVLPDQFIDFTKTRRYTFYDGGRTVHVSTADPFCEELRGLLAASARRLGLRLATRGTYICIDGPRFSTRAESRMFRTFADVIGMTLCPEVQLAREQEMCYASIAMVTDYDVWAERPVSAEEVMKTFAQNVRNTERLLEDVLQHIPEKRAGCGCGEALKSAGV
ncbi:MAG: S-methyl-5'-thioadenosine phosphorylase [Thermoplasmatota archaeon]